MKTNISKKVMVSELLANNIVLEIAELQKIYGWLSGDENVMDEKWHMLQDSMKSRNEEAVMAVPASWLWANDEKADEKKIIIKDNSIDTFEKNLDTLRGAFGSSTITRTKNWIREKGFKKVSQIIEHGSQKTRGDRKMGKTSIEAVSKTLERYYAIGSW